MFDSTVNSRGKLSLINALRWVALGILLMLAAACAVASFAVAVPGNIDDGFITLVYARNFAESGVFYYNDPSDVVDGFTSFLDVVLKGAVIRCSGSDPIALAFVVTILYQLTFAAAGVLLMCLIRPITLCGKMGVVLGAIACGLSPETAYGASFFLETPLFVALTLAAIWITLRADSSIARAGKYIILFLLVLCRPEGLAVSGVLLAADLFLLRRGFSRSERFVPPLILLGCVAAYFAWRIFHFGHWAPNSYYAKLSLSRLDEVREGFRYVKQYALAHPAGLVKLGMMLLAPLALLIRWRRHADRSAYAVLASVVLTLLLAIVASGGDCYSGGRLLAAPAVLSIAALTWVASSTSRAAWVALAALLFCVTAETITLLQKDPLQKMRQWPVTRQTFACQQYCANRLTELFPGATIAHSDFQLFKYFEKNARVIDLHGLNDSRIAHQRVDRPVSLGKFSHANGIAVNADIWLHGMQLYSDRLMAKEGVRAVLTDRRLLRQFSGYHRPHNLPTPGEIDAIEQEYVACTLITQCGGFFNFFLRKKWVVRPSPPDLAIGRMVGPAPAQGLKPRL